MLATHIHRSQRIVAGNEHFYIVVSFKRRARFVQDPQARADKRCWLRCMAMTDGFRWEPPPLPEDPRELRSIRTRLVILAIIGLLAHVISAMAR